MKILFLNRYQDINDRGAEVFIKELSKRLSETHIVDIFTGDKASSLPAVLEGHYDVVIPVNGRFQALKLSLGRMIGGYKILITGHSGKGWDDIINILVKPDIFVALTSQARDWAKNWSWGSKIIKIPNGIDLEKFNPVGKKVSIDLPRPIILSVGALVWYKYHQRVIEAVSRLESGSLLIVGQGSLKDELEREGKRKLGDRFKILSFPNDEMPNIYRSCDLFTLPSWNREAFGIVYLEALASGLGVVAPDDQTRHEIIGDAGIYTDVSDASVYSKALGRALKTDWTKKARAQASTFSWDKIAKMYEDVLLKLKK